MGLMDFIKKDPTPLDHVRDSLDDRATQRDFVALLKEHHGFLEESIAVLMNAEATAGEKQANLARLLQLLNMHGRAEEETLYVQLRQSEVKNARMQGLAGHDEHDLAFQLGDELTESDFEGAWTEEVDAKAKVLAGLVHNHIHEEETEMFNVAETTLSAQTLEEQVTPYLLKCRTYFDSDLSLPRLSAEDPPTLTV